MINAKIATFYVGQDVPLISETVDRFGDPILTCEQATELTDAELNSAIPTEPPKAERRLSANDRRAIARWSEQDRRV